MFQFAFQSIQAQKKLEAQKEKLNLLERNRKYWYDIGHNPNNMRQDFTFVVVIFLFIR